MAINSNGLIDTKHKTVQTVSISIGMNLISLDLISDWSKLHAMCKHVILMHGNAYFR